MKIVLINTDANQGGAAIACSRLNIALNMSGVKSIVFNRSLLSKWNDKRIFFHFMIEKFVFLFFQASWQVKFKFSIPFLGINIATRKEIKNADILHLHWINNGFLSLKSLKKISELNKPIVWTLHDMGAFTGGCFHSRECTNFEQDCGNCFYLKCPKQHDLSNRILTKKRNLYPQLNLHVVTCSNWLGERARRSSLFQNVSVHVIPNPIDVERFKPINKKVSRGILKMSADSFVILFVAASISDDRKGISYLIEAINKLVALKPELKNVIELVVLGNVKNNEQFPFPCKTNFTGYVSDETTIINYFSASNIFITPSLDENLPNTVMESLSCGTPVVAFKTGGIPDLIDHKINGYLADYKSSDDLVNGILWAYENRLDEQINKNARNKVLNNYTYEIVAKKYIRVYESIINSHAKN